MSVLGYKAITVMWCQRTVSDGLASVLLHVSVFVHFLDVFKDVAVSQWCE